MRDLFSELEVAFDKGWAVELSPEEVGILRRLLIQLDYVTDLLGKIK